MTNNILIPRFTIGFPQVPEPAVNIWRHLIGFLAEQKALPKSVKLRSIIGPAEKRGSILEIRLPVDKVENLILERNLIGFDIYAGSGSKSFTYALMNGYGARRDCLLSCYFEKEARVPAPWNSLIEEIISEHPSVGAWSTNIYYGSWQEADNIHRFYEQLHGKLPPGYKTWTKPFLGPALTPQPDIVMVDVSRNPGRAKVLLQDVQFYASAEMWLGPHFWQHAKCTKEEVLAADFFLEKRDTPQYLYLKCWPKPFTRPDGEEGRMQQRLWKLFFHEDCEWPPGSGTICDEPMYGPLELMPQEPPAENKL